jgi:hypothetical protein
MLRSRTAKAPSTATVLLPVTNTTGNIPIAAELKGQALFWSSRGYSVFVAVPACTSKAAMIGSTAAPSELAAAFTRNIAIAVADIAVSTRIACTGADSYYTLNPV